MNDCINQFRIAIQSAGLVPPEVIESDGTLHRFASNGKPTDDAGWYVLYDDSIPAGAFGDWRTGTSETWRMDIGRKLAPEEEALSRARLATIGRQREAEEMANRAEARQTALAIWQAAEPACDNHGYLIAKGVNAHGVRIYEGKLIVPLYDGDELHSLQFIAFDGGKKFLPRGRVKGCYFSIGKPDGVLCITEGYATGASVHEATGFAVAVAFNAANLVVVAQSLHQRFPQLRLILCADDDMNTKGNPGLSKAREAARAAEGFVAVPDFDVNQPEGAKDFNDLFQHAGPEAVRACIEHAASGSANEAVPVVFRRLSDVQSQSIRWLWPGRFARGKVSMIAGNPGLGKSQVTGSMAAIVTTGGQWPAEGGSCETGSVVFLSAEDNAADTIKPRLVAARADTSRCYILDAVTDHGPDGGNLIRSFDMQRDLDRLAALLRRIGDVALVVIDPISAYLGGIDSHKNADIRALLAPLTDLAAKHGAAVVCVSHLNKSGSSEALLRVTGSLAFVAAARAAYIVTRDNNEPQRRLFLPLKNNIGNDQAGLAFEVVSCELDGGIQTSRVMWEDEPVSVTADEAMRPAEPDEERSQRDDIADWLTDLLYPMRMRSQDVQSKAKQEGFAWRTVQRTARDAGVVMKREGFGPNMVTYWSLAPVAPSYASHASAEMSARLDLLGANEEVERGEL